MQKIKINKTELKFKLILMLIVAICLGVSCIFSDKIESALHIGKTDKSGKYMSVEVVNNSNLKCHYIDVGQADCTFIELPDGSNLLIDAGDKATKTQVVEYIKALNVTVIDYFVLTHSDSDHVGGAAEVLSEFEVVNIYRPFAISGSYTGTSTKLDEFEALDVDDLGNVFEKLKTDYEAVASKLPRVTTAVYKSTIESIYQETYTDNGVQKESNVAVNYDGLEISSSDRNNQFNIKFYAPLKVTGDIDIVAYGNCRTQGYVTKGYGATTATGYNAVSPVIKLEYMQQKFVFTGDIYDTAEKEVLNSLTSLEREELSNVSVYQAGHHGATNSNTQDWLNLLNPDYTVVSCGKDNKYGHPTSEFLKRLENLKPTITDYLLRTDLQGNIIFGVSTDTATSSGAQLIYAANVEISNSIFEIQWWYLAVGIYVVFVVLLWSIRFKSTTKKRRYSKR